MSVGEAVQVASRISRRDWGRGVLQRQASEGCKSTPGVRDKTVCSSCREGKEEKEKEEWRPLCASRGFIWRAELGPLFEHGAGASAQGQGFADQSSSREGACVRWHRDKAIRETHLPSFGPMLLKSLTREMNVFAPSPASEPCVQFYDVFYSQRSACLCATTCAMSS